MNWGKSIVLAFILFAGLVATMVTICVRQDISLVTPNYYQEEIAYQKQIDRLTETEGLRLKPSIGLTEGSVQVTYDDFDKIEGGVLLLFRPSSASHDRRFRLPTNGPTIQYFNTDGLPTGMYRARMSWSMEGKEYYLEQELML